MDELVLRIGLVVLGIGVTFWLALSATTILGRWRFDRRHARLRTTTVLNDRAAARLVRRVRREPRSEWGSWRRVLALQRLARVRHPSVPGLIRNVLEDPDPRIATAAIGALGEIGDDWAIETLIDALRRGLGSRSRVAAVLEELAPCPRDYLLPLLRDRDPSVRFWAATLLQAYPDIGEAPLIELTWDRDPNVRAAAVETLGTREGDDVATALVARLDDDAWFVRVHAARAAAEVAGAEAAPSIVHLLAEERWWVRTAAKDALRGLGADAVPALLSVLEHDDRFARNGAAEVLQDIGFVDFLALESPHSPLLERIYAAGGESYREAAERRVGSLVELDSEEVRVA